MVREAAEYLWLAVGTPTSMGAPMWCNAVERLNVHSFGGAKLNALLFSAEISPLTPCVRKMDENSDRFAATSLMVPLR